MRLLSPFLTGLLLGAVEGHTLRPSAVDTLHLDQAQQRDWDQFNDFLLLLKNQQLSESDPVQRSQLKTLHANLKTNVLYAPNGVSRVLQSSPEFATSLRNQGAKSAMKVLHNQARSYRGQALGLIQKKREQDLASVMGGPFEELLSFLKQKSADSLEERQRKEQEIRDREEKRRLESYVPMNNHAPLSRSMSTVIQSMNQLQNQMKNSQKGEDHQRMLETTSSGEGSLQNTNTEAPSPHISLLDESECLYYHFVYKS